MKSLHGASSDKVIHVKSHMACPVKQKDGTWKVVLKDYEEDIPDLGREDLICNKCGWTDYPNCKETWCKAWVRHTKKK
jgi:hypothetical protein